MHTIAITVGEDIIARNIIETDFWPELKRLLPDFCFVLLVQPEREEYCIDRFADERVSVRSFKRAVPGRLERVMMSLARSGINTHTNLWSKMRSYYRGDSGLFVTWLKRVEAATLGNSVTYKRLLRRLIELLPLDTEAEGLFTELKPDIFLPLSLTNYDFDVPLARSARARGVRILGMVRSWDNLSSHGLLRVVPDKFYFQNIFLKNMAHRYQAIAPSLPSAIVGLPHYDKYAITNLLPREEFLQQMGLDPSKKVVFYGAMGEFLFTAEDTMPRVLEEVAAQLDNVTVVYRAHPKFKSASLETHPHILFDRDTSYMDSGILSSETRLMHYLAYADAVVTSASTIAIDAVVFGRRPICIAFDPRLVSYWLSVQRFFDTYTHFEAFMETKAAVQVDTFQELMKALQTAFAKADADPVACARARALLVEPCGEAGKRLAQSLARDIVAA